MSLKELESQIELLRNELIISGLKEGLGSKRTLLISQKLDTSISKYQAWNHLQWSKKRS